MPLHYTTLIVQIPDMTDRGEYDEAFIKLEDLKKDMEEKEVAVHMSLLQLEIKLILGDVDAINSLTAQLEEKVGSPFNRFVLDSIKAIFSTLMGDYDKARELFDTNKQLDEKSSIDHPLFNYWTSFYYNCRGIFTVETGDSPSGKALFEKAYIYAKKSKSSRRLTSALDNLGVVHRYLGNLDMAYSYQMRVLEARLKVGDMRSIAIAKGNLSELQELRGNYEESRILAEETLEILLQMGSDEEIGQAYQNMARSYYHLEDYEIAKKYFEEALKYRMNVGSPLPLAKNYYYYILLLVKCNELQKAKKEILNFPNNPHENMVVTLYYDLSLIQLGMAIGEDSEELIQKINCFQENNDFNRNLTYVAKILKIQLMIQKLQSDVGEPQPIKHEIQELKKVVFDNRSKNLETYILQLEASLAISLGNVNEGIQILNEAETLARTANYCQQLAEIQRARDSVRSGLKLENVGNIKENDANDLNNLIERFINILHSPPN